MKIRNGFVSNSSSSSFVVPAKSSMEAFRKAIKVVEGDYCNSGVQSFRDAWYEIHEPKVERFLQKYPDKNFNQGIIIPFTCNFETYIFPSKNGKCLIETCNNCDWEDGFSDLVYVDNDFYHSTDDEIVFIDMSTLKKYTGKEYYDLPYNDKSKFEDAEDIEKDFVTIRLSDVKRDIDREIDIHEYHSNGHDDFSLGARSGLKQAWAIVKMHAGK